MRSPDASEILSGEREVEVSFVRYKNGKVRTIPVWFTLNSGKIELLPMYGLNTKWFLDVEKSGRVGLKVKGWTKDARPKIVRDSKAVEAIVTRFGAKYGAGDVKRYYPKSEVALEIPV